jgi:chromosome segregation ATPase
MIADAKSNEGQQDPQLMNLLKRLEKEAGQIGDQLKDISIKEGDLKKKREDAKATIDDAYANPENYNPQQIDTVAENIGELNEKTKGHNDKVDKIDKDLDRRIEELSDLLSASSTTKALEKDINSNLAQMKEDLGNLRDLLSKLPGTINALVEILNQMKQGSLPDKSADYWEEREDIEKWLANLIKLQETLKDL